MRLRNRFLLIGFGLLAFAIATPLLILYAQGYKYDWSTHQIVKTGSLIVNTEPTKAQVLLNGVLQKGLTPSSLRFLTPGDYEVTIQKSGYQSWSKRLTIQARFVTWASQGIDEVNLFLDSPKFLSSQSGTFTAPVVADDKQKILALLQNLQIPAPQFSSGTAISGNNQIYLILDGTLYLVNGQLQKIYSPVTNATYDSSSGQLLFANNNEIYLFDPITQNSQLILRTLTPIGNAVLNSATGYIFYSDENQIKAVELDGRDQRNNFQILSLDRDFQYFTVSDDGNKLTVLDATESKQYGLR